MNNHKDLDVWKKGVSSKKAKVKSQSKAVIAQERDCFSRILSQYGWAPSQRQTLVTMPRESICHCEERSDAAI